MAHVIHTQIIIVVTLNDLVVKMSSCKWVCVPNVAVIDVEGEANDSKQDSQPSKDGHGHKELLGQVAKLLDDHGLVCRGSWS